MSSSNPKEGDNTLDFTSLSLSSEESAVIVQSGSDSSAPKKREDPLDFDGAVFVGEEDAKKESNEIKIDSKSDFLSAMRAGFSTGDADEVSTPAPSPKDEAPNPGAESAKAMIKAFGSARGNRRWMTAPTLALSTIRESDDFEGELSAAADDDELIDSSIKAVASSLASSSNDSLDDEMVIKTTNKAKPRQMRVPKVSRASTLSANVFDGKSDPFSGSASVPTTDREIETAGTAFLEVIGKSLGYR